MNGDIGFVEKESLLANVIYWQSPMALHHLTETQKRLDPRTDPWIFATLTVG